MLAQRLVAPVGVTVMLSALLAVVTGLLESVTCAVTANVPVTEGIPLITPVVAFSATPGGSVPVTAHLKGVVPPVAVRVPE